MASSTIATVVSISSTAYARSAEGELRELSAGDVLMEGETVVTPDGGHVELELIDGSPLVVSDMPEILLTRDLVAERTATREESAAEDESIDLVLAALEGGKDLGDVLDATAAGDTGGNSAHGSSFYRLARIVEHTSEFSGLGDGSSLAESIVVAQGAILPVDAVDDESETELDTSVIISVEDNDQFVDGSIVTAVTQAQNGSVVINADDTVTYTPDEGFSGSDTFTYTATSPDGRNADTATVTVKVNGESIPELVPNSTPEPLPTLSIGNEKVVEGGVAEVTVTLSAASGKEVTVNFGSSDESASVVGGDYNAVTGEIVFSPGETSKVILVAINDDSLVEDTEQFTVNLSSPVNATIVDGEGVVTILDNDVPGSIPTTPATPPLNNAPVAEDDFKTTTEDTPVVISVLNNDSDSNGDLLNVAIAGDPSNGNVVINADKTISYIPDDNFNGEDTFMYTVSDGKGGTDTATVNITVTPVVDGFSDTNESLSTQEDTPISGNVIDGSSVHGPVTVTGFEVDGTSYSAGDTATFAGVGSLLIGSTGAYTFTPVANYHGPVPVATYTLSDGVTTTETSTLSLTVTPVTDGFSDDNESVSTQEDTAVSGNVIDGSSVDGPVTVTGFEVGGTSYSAGDTATMTGVGSLLIGSTGAYTFTPVANYHGPVPVATYTLSDGVTTNEISTLSLTVTPVTDGFSDNNETVSTAEDTAVSGNVIDGSSVDGPVTVTGFEVDGTSYSAGDTVIITGIGSLVIGSTGAYTFTPVANYHGPVPVATYTLSDGVTSTETSTLSLTVTPVTDGFSDDNESVSTQEDNPISGNVIDGSSVDGPVTVTGFEVNGTTYGAGDTATMTGVGSLLIGSTGAYTFTPVANYHGPVPVATYTLSDGVTTTETSTLSLTVTPVTDGFSDDNESVFTQEDTPVSGNVIDGSSVDGPVTVTGFELGGTSYSAGDAAAIAGVGSLQIGSTGAYTFTPVANYHGPVPVVTYTLSDGVTTTETSTLSLTVTPVTDGFSDGNESVSTQEDTPVSGNVIDGSSEDGPVTVTGFEVGGNTYVAGDTVIITGVGSLIIGSTGAYTFTPVADYHGPVPVATYTLSDGVTTTETSTLSLTVTPVTDGFSDNDETLSTQEDTPVSGNVIDGSSVDGPVTVTGFEVGGTTYGAGDTAAIAGIGSLQIGSTGAYTFTPVANYHGPVPVATYTLSDGVTTTETSTLSLTVTPITDGFSDGNESASTQEDTPISGNVIDGTSVDGPVTVTGFEVGGNTYVAGDTVIITGVGSLIIGSTGAYTFTPVANYHGPIPVATYTLSDGVTTTETSTLSLTVTPVTDGFSDDNESVSAQEDTPVSGNVIDGSSVDGPVTVTGFEVGGTTYGAGDTVIITGIGSLVIGSTGAYTFTPVPNYHGPVPVATYTLSDGVTTTETSTLSLTVTPVTDGFSDDNESVFTQEDTPVSGNVIDGSSVDGPVTVTGFELGGTSYSAGDAAAIAGVGSLQIGSTGAYTFTPVANYNGPVPVVTYTLSDGVTTTETSTLSLTVTPVTDGFSDGNESVSTQEDTPVSGNVIDGSSEDGPVTVTGFEVGGNTYVAGDTVIITGVGSLIIGSTGAYTFTPVADYHGPVPVATYTLSDGVTTTETSTLSLTVTPVTDGFSDNDETLSTQEDTPVSGNVIDGSSVDGPVTVTGFEVGGTTYGAGDTAAIAGIGSLQIGSTGAYTFTPVANYHGPVPVATYTLSDGVTTTETSTLSLTVTPITDGFSDGNESASTQEDTPISGNVIDGTSVDGPVTVTGFEVGGTSYSAGDTATIAGVGSLQIGSTGAYTFTPVPNYHGPVPVATYTLSDGVTTTETSTLSLTVTPITDGFSDDNESLSTQEDTPISGNVIDGTSADGPVTVTGFEVDGTTYSAGDTVIITGVGSLFIGSTGAYTFTPVANYHGPVPVATYTLSDGVTTNETSTLSLTVTPVTDGFSDDNETVSTSEDTPVSGNVIDGSSVDGTVTVTGFEVGGTTYGAGDTVIITGIGSLVIGSTGAYTFTPVANYHGPVPVATYTLSDGVTTTETSTLSLTVTPLTDGFSDNNETVSTAEDTPVSGNVIDGSSVDGPVTVTGFEVGGTTYGAGDTATMTGVGSLQIGSTGAYTFTPVANYHGPVPVATYTLSDGVTTTETSTLSLTVTPVTDGFSDNDETLSTQEDTPVSGNVIDGSSVDGPVTVTGFEVGGTSYSAGDTATMTGVGSLLIGSTGAYTFTPVANYHGPVPVATYTLSDGVTSTETSTLSLTVTPVTDGFSDNSETVSTAEDTAVSGNVIDGSSVDGPVTVTGFEVGGNTYGAGDTVIITGVGSLIIGSTGAYTFTPVANYHGPVPVATYTLSDGVTTTETSTLSLTVTPVTDGFSDNNESVSTQEDTPISGNVIDGSSVDGPVTVTGFEVGGTTYGAGDTATMTGVGSLQIGSTGAYTFTPVPNYHGPVPVATYTLSDGVTTTETSTLSLTVTPVTDGFSDNDETLSTQEDTPVSGNVIDGSSVDGPVTVTGFEVGGTTYGAGDTVVMTGIGSLIIGSTGAYTFTPVANYHGPVPVATYTLSDGVTTNETSTLSLTVTPVTDGFSDNDEIVTTREDTPVSGNVIDGASVDGPVTVTGFEVGGTSYSAGDTAAIAGVGSLQIGSTGAYTFTPVANYHGPIPVATYTLSDGVTTTETSTLSLTVTPVTDGFSDDNETVSTSEDTPVTGNVIDGTSADGPVTVTGFEVDGTTYSAGDTVIITGIGSLVIGSTGAYTFTPVANYHGPVPVATYTLSDGVTTTETSTLSLTVTPLTDGFSDNNETVSTAEDTPVSGNVIDGSSVDGPVTVTGFEVGGTTYGAGDTATMTGVGSLQIGSTGAYTFTPVANYHGPVPVATYTLSDGVTTTETSTLSLTVTPVTDGFSDNDESVSTQEDTPISGNVIDGTSLDGPVTVTGFDVGGASYSAGDTATMTGVGSLFIGSTGAYTFTPVANYHGPVPVATYTLSDGVTTTETSTLSLTVTPVTDGFSDNNETVSTAEDTAVSGNVIDGTSVDGPVTVTGFEVGGTIYSAGDTVIITGVGSLIIGSTGAYTFTPVADYHGPVPVATYTLSDGVTTTETSTLSLTVTPVTDGFSDNDETLSTREDTPISGNVIDGSSVDGPVTMTGFEVGGTTYGASDTATMTGVGSLLIGSTGAYTFTPVANYHGPVPVATYTLSDGVTTTETSTLSLTVTPVTDGFSDGNESVSTQEDTPISGNVIDGTSADGPVTVTGFEVDGTTYSAGDTVIITGIGSLVIGSTGAYTFTPVADYHGPVPVATYTLSDGVTTTETSTLSLTVTPVTDGFSDNDETLSTQEDTPVSGNVIDGSSVDGPVTVTGFEVGGTTYGAGDTVVMTGIGSLIIGSTGAYTFTPVANYHGPVPVATYTLSDGVTTTETSTLSLTVTPVTDGFSDDNESVSTQEDTPISGNVIDGTSVDGPVTVTGFEVGGTSYSAGDTATMTGVGSLLIGSTGAYTFTPVANYHGPVPVATYTLSDGVTTTETSTLSLTVTPITDGFSDNNESASTQEDTPISGNVIDGSSVDGPITVTGFEVGGNTYGAGDTVIITGVGSLVIGSTGAYTFTPVADYHGPVPVATYTLSDGVTTTETSTLSLTVTPVTDGFSDNDETLSTQEDTPVSGNVIDGSSVDGPVTVTGFEVGGTTYGAGDTAAIAGIGSLQIGSTGAYTFTPVANYHGPVPVATYTLSDGVTTTETSTLSLTVTPVTDGFSDNDETLSTQEDTPVSGNVIDGSSVDGPVTVTGFEVGGTTYGAGDTAAIAGIGSLQIGSTGAYTFTPVANYHGPVPVATYTLSDGVTTTETSTLSLTVTPITDGFSDGNESASTQEDTPISGNVIDGTSVDGPVTVTGFEVGGTSYSAGDTATIAGVGSLQIGSTGAYTFTPVPNYHGPVPVATYTLSDGVTTTETSTLSLTVTPITDGFSDDNESLSTQEDTPISGNVIDGTSADGPVTVTGFEVDGTTYSAGDTVIITGVGSLFIGSTGAYTFTPVANYHGPVPVATYTLSDGVTTNETSTLSLTVTPVTDGFSDDNETVSTSEDTPVSGNVIDGSSVDGPVTVTGFEVGGTTYGAGDTATMTGVGSLLIGSTGAYTFTPVANYHGPVPVATYTLSDGVTTTETSTLSLTVTPVTDGFSDNSETVSTAEDTPVSGNVIDGSSVDGPVTVTGFEVGGTTYGAGDTVIITGVGSLVIGSTGAYTFTPVADYHGPVPVATYTLSDGVTTTETSTLSLAVTPVTDGFSDNNETVSTTEDTAVIGNVIDGSSVDGPVTVTGFEVGGTTYSAGDTVIITGVGSLIIGSTGAYTFTPVADYHGPVPVATYTLSDGVTTNETSTLSLTVTPVTDGFGDDNESVSTQEDTPISGNVIDGSSVDGPITVTGFELGGTTYGAGDTATMTGIGSLQIGSTGAYTFTPVANYHGPVPVATYSLSDGVTTNETSTLSLTVTPVTDGFSDNSETVSTAEDTPVSGNVIDGSSVDGPVTVTGFEVGGTTYGAGDTVVMTGVGSLVIGSTGAYTFTPVANYHGPVPVATYTLSDGVSTTETSTLSLTVTPVTDGFSDNDETLSTQEDTPVSGNVIDGSSVDGTVTVTGFEVGGTSYSAGDTATIAGVGSLQIGSTGAYTFTPVANYHGPVPVATYTLSDGVTTNETSTLSLTVTPLTDGFSDNDEIVTAQEDTPVSGNVIDGSSVDGPVTVTGFEVGGTSYSAGDTATMTGIGSLQIGSTGAYTFTPVANYHGPVPVATYTLSDGVTTNETSTLSLTVAPVTDGFGDDNETVSTVEDTPVSGNVIDGTSVDGPVTVTGFEVGGTSYSAGDTATMTGVGSLLIGSTGAYTFTPVANYHGPVPVATYTLSDGVTTTETSTLSLTVTPVTDGFSDDNESVSTQEDTPISGNVIDGSSVDGPVTVTGFEVGGTTYSAGDTATMTGVGSLQIGSTGAYTFTPVANYHGPVPVATYTLSDGVTTTETSTLSLTVTPVTDGFSDDNESVSTQEDTPVSGNVIDGSSVDGPVTVTGFEVGGTTYGAGDTVVMTGVGSLVIGSTGAYTFTPVANYHGPVPVATYTLSDGVTTTETSTLSLTVTPVTDGFSDNNETVSTAEDTPVSGNVIDGSSVDGPVTVTGFEVDGASYSAGDTVVITGVGSLTIGSTGAYTFTPVANYHGPVPVATYTLSDGVTTNETSTLSLTVTPVVDSFSDNDETLSTQEDTPVSGNVIDGSSVHGPVTVTGFEVDGTTYGTGDTATITGVGSLQIGSTGAYTFTPVANYHGPVPVATYTLSDGVTTDTSTLSLTVTPVGDTFKDRNERVTTAEDTPVSGNVIDGTSVDGPITVTTFQVTGDGTTYNAGDTATITGVGSITIGSTGDYTFTPAENYVGKVPVVSYSLSDGSDPGDTSKLSIRVIPGTDGFSDNDEIVSTAEDMPVSGNVIDGSSDNGPVTITGFEIEGTNYSAGDTAIITGVGSLVIGSTGAYTFTPVANYHGPVPVATYTLSDGVITNETSTLSLTVTPVIDGFSDDNESVSTQEDTSVSGNVIDGSSVDGPVTVTGFEVGGTTYGAGDTAIITGIGSMVIGSSGAYTFTPVANYHGPVPVATYTLSDGVTTNETSTLSVTVTPVSNGISDNDEIVSTAEDVPISGNVIDGSSVEGPVIVTTFQVAGDGNTYSAGDTATITGVGTLTIGSTGGYTFTPDANYSGTVPVVTYSLGDGTDSNDTSKLFITVTPIADVPTASVEISGLAVIDTSEVVPIGVTLGSAKGDDAIDGTEDFDYDETVSTLIDLGALFADAIVNVELDVTVGGSWNQDGDGGYFDDNWGISVNGTPTAVFFYNSDNTSTITTTDMGDGVTAYRHGTPGDANQDIDFNHKPILPIVLDENGQADLVFGAQTTSQTEVITINGLELDPPDIFEYSVDLSAALSDLDSSEVLSVLVNGPADGLLVSNTPDILVTKIVDGQWSIESVPAGSLSMNIPASDLTFSVFEGTVFDLEIVATATDADGASGAVTVTDNTGVIDGDMADGQLIDGIVAGINYATSSGLSGQTDEQGNFSFMEGDTITFSIGNVVLGSVTSEVIDDGIVFLQEIAGVGLQDLNNDYVENMALFLQSLDNDGDAYNGIVISEGMHQAFSDENFDLATISKEGLHKVLQDNGLTPVSEDEAMQHVKDMLMEHADVTGFDERSPADAGAPVMGDSDEDIVVTALNEQVEVENDGAQNLLDSDEDIVVTALNEQVEAENDGAQILLDSDEDIVVTALNEQVEGENDGPQILLDSGEDVVVFSLSDEAEAENDVSFLANDQTTGDALDLSDLLLGEEAEGADLTSYLNVSFDGTDTIIEVSAAGEFTGSVDDSSIIDQTFTLEGVDLVAGNALEAVIQDMLSSGKLIVDQ